MFLMEHSLNIYTATPFNLHLYRKTSMHQIPNMMQYEKPSTWTGNLQSCAVYLTEDYAAKISDFSFLNNGTTPKVGPATMMLLESRPESNVYSFGLILFEMITCRIPYSVDNGSFCCRLGLGLLEKVSTVPLKEMVDTTLKFFQQDELASLFQVVKTRVNPVAKERPIMREIAANLNEITAVGPDGATSKLSPFGGLSLKSCTRKQVEQ
ncbi:hypothetical protein F3Y22_tig00110556pilonHSYRG00786 [Hibiscus syriacus]|uniref:Protein kinase domain-containing protein n=1 Tax=Hibiscus syriacus TaxID=106335 RepID=A0A6A3AAS0_HIBSY|nr:hypothetical protein F3Y22_tig00110556pilonHSYRG00786 [Hibiscus syriacus]